MGILLVLIWGGFGTRIENFFIYQPSREIFLTPADLGVPFEEVRFSAPDGPTLYGWFVAGRQSPRGPLPTLLWLHGNGGNLSHRAENIVLLHEKLAANVFIFDYRGYGLSEGTPSEGGTYADAEGAIRYLLSRKDVDEKRIVLFGRSLGASVAITESLRRPPAGLILESPFTSIVDMAKRMFFVPLGPLIRTRYDNMAKIGRVRVPILLLHGDQDEIVPFWMGETLFKAAPNPKDFYRIRGAMHNDTYVTGGEPYFQRLREFIDNLFSGDGDQPHATSAPPIPGSGEP